MSYYVILGVPVNADAATIRRAFRGLVRQYHPDAGAGSSAQRFRESVQAYETLSDPERRREYDASLQPPSIPVRVEPLIRDDRQTIVFHRTPGFSRVVDIGAYDRDVFNLFRMIDKLFWEF
jgi:curved DNA-binding protein CbpA